MEMPEVLTNGNNRHQAEHHACVAKLSQPLRLNIGVVGIGRMGQRHTINLLHNTRRANLICACSPAKSDLEWADEHLIPYGVSVVPTFEEMVETPGLQAVVIASATHLHPEHTLACLRRGIHVLCEKPIATSTDQVSSENIVTRDKTTTRTHEISVLTSSPVDGDDP